MDEINFSQKLNEYIKILKCTAKELSKTTGLSPSVISRYRQGERTPKYQSKQLEALINGLSILAKEKNIKNMNEPTIRKDLEESLNKNKYNFEIFRKNLNTLINTLNINVADISRYINYDASYISKIRTGNRKPQNINNFANAICNFISKYYNNSKQKEIISSLINYQITPNKNDSEIYNSLKLWLTNNIEKEHNYIDNFLLNLDEFDLDEYIKAIKFDKIKVPTSPIKLSISKKYYGLEGFKNSQLNVLKSITLSNSNEDVLFYSNMPMIEASKDLEFTKKFMIGLAFILKKGINLKVIHNLDRPVKEIMMGLEGWIPLYMTGQISSYYFKNKSNNIFSQIICTGGKTALYGSCITNHINTSNLYLTNKTEEVKHYQEISKLLLKEASSLIDIYNINRKNEFNDFLINSSCITGNRKNILTNLPNYVLSDSLLIKILGKNNIDTEDKKYIIESINKEKDTIKEILKSNIIVDEIHILSEDEFKKEKYYLNLSIIFYDKKKIEYTYEDYLEHLKLLKNYQMKNKNYQYIINEYKTFKNINIHITNNKFVIISKMKSPTIHLVLNHPILIKAIENFETQLIES
ncbi:MAG: hypothetical protein ACI4WU_01085 [Bacilli bacterium]